jgi:pyruvate formate lyase activating enzyme
VKSIKIAGFQKQSFVDYPGEIAAVIFLGGCNFRCHYCHNNQILSSDSNVINFADFLSEIEPHLDYITAVVIGGGEPTMHPNLRDIAVVLKKLNLLVKLDTNGTNTQVVADLVTDGLVDYVAMDIKAPVNKYPEITGCGVDAGSLIKTIEYLKKQDKVDYMFRTTLSPFLNQDDIKNIGELVSGAKCFQLQQYVPNDFARSHEVVGLPYSSEDAKRFQILLKKYCSEVLLRGF